MIEAYKRYKDWWIEHQSEYYMDTVSSPTGWGWNSAEHAFVAHLNTFNNYELMETLVDWSYHLEVPTGN